MFLSSVVAISQSISVVSELESTVQESSGLLYLDGRLITHNDSSGEAALYEIDPASGNVVRTVAIQGATNRDWEDIARDENFIYIGDFGNNSGTRTDLRIYKVGIADYLDNDDLASAEVIAFSYEDQTDFSSAPQDTNFDAEALISLGDRLYIFTKNWVDNRSNVYRLPKSAGTVVAEKKDEINSEGLVTGASFSADLGKVLLCGYGSTGAFMIELTGFADDDFSGGFFAKRNLQIPFGNSFQVEGITYSDGSNIYLSSEANALGSPTLFSIPVSALSVGEMGLKVRNLFPNPVTDYLQIDLGSEISKLQIYDSRGRLVRETTGVSDRILLNDLSPGLYVMKLFSENGHVSAKVLKE